MSKHQPGFAVGDLVRVTFGTREVEAEVLEIRGGRAIVRLKFEDADESIRTSYRAAELQPA